MGANKTDLNRSSLEEICRLPGITRELGERIIRHRPYKRLDELTTKRVLGRKQFARIREQVTVVSSP